MKRNIITTDDNGNIIMPTDIGATAMSEWELCELFGVTAPTVRACVKALCKSGVLMEYGIKHTVRLSDKCDMEVYGLETIIALAFRIGTSGAKQVRNAVLERLHLRKEKQTVLFSLNMTDIASPKYLA
nr:hypothetical protein [uncultured Alistipes sp.]